LLQGQSYLHTLLELRNSLHARSTAQQSLACLSSALRSERAVPQQPAGSSSNLYIVLANTARSTATSRGGWSCWTRHATMTPMQQQHAEVQQSAEAAARSLPALCCSVTECCSRAYSTIVLCLLRLRVTLNGCLWAAVWWPTTLWVGSNGNTSRLHFYFAGSSSGAIISVRHILATEPVCTTNHS
jgi:hypothetical protein